MHDLTIERVDLRVADAGRSQEFYEHILGTEPPLRLRDDGIRPERSPRRAAGLFHTAFLFESRAGLGAAVRRVLDAGVPLTGASDHGVSEAIYLDDPDGNGIELYWDRPREVWPESMFTEPLDLQPILRGAADEGGVRVGHVHFKASDLRVTTDFWLDLGLDLFAALHQQASFLAADGYHHHVGVNVWMSQGAQPTPPDVPGLDGVVLCSAGIEPGERRDPDGVLIDIVARG